MWGKGFAFAMAAGVAAGHKLQATGRRPRAAGLAPRAARSRSRGRAAAPALNAARHPERSGWLRNPKAVANPER